MIDSKAEADKNKLSTGTLTFSDLHNEAEYEASSKGVNINTGKGAKTKDAGITPDIGMPAGDKAESDTRSAVAEGAIEIKDKEHQQQDIENLSRDTENSLNRLEEIFDRETVEERRELAKMFGETAYNEIHRISDIYNLDDSSAEKNAMHAIIGGIMSELTNNDFISGASGAMVNEMLQHKLKEIFKNDPAMHQWASAFIGGIVSQLISENAYTGSSSAVSGTKDNAYGIRPRYEGAIIFIQGLGFFRVENGQDVYMTSAPPVNSNIWIQDANNPLYGWDYRKGNGIDEPDRYIDEKIIWSKYIEVDGIAYGVTIADYTDAQKTIYIQQAGKTYLMLHAIARNPDFKDIFDSLDKETLDGKAFEHVNKLLQNIIREYYPKGGI